MIHQRFAALALIALAIDCNTVPAVAADEGDHVIAIDILVEYVQVFVPEHSGEHYLPHVTTGIAKKEFLDKMAAEPFDAFTFSPVGAAVYHLGNYGTATTKLHEFVLERE